MLYGYITTKLKKVNLGMIKIFEGYAFVQVNTFGIIQQIDEEKFGNYNKLLRVFLPIQNLYLAYRNVNL